MPTYEYECDQCRVRFERVQAMSAPQVDACPECGGSVHRLISGGAAFIVKGAAVNTAEAPGSPPSCGRDTRCCGRREPCETKPCQ